MDEKKLHYLKDYRDLKKKALKKLNPTSSITRNGKQTPYANLTDYIVLINEIIEEHNFFWIERIVDNQNGFETIYLKLVHEEGEETPESSKAIHVNENMQTNGSAQTYARRYLFMILLGIHGEADNDGQETVKQPKYEPKQSNKTPLPWKGMEPGQLKSINEAIKSTFDDQSAAIRWLCEKMEVKSGHLKDLNGYRFDEIMKLIT